MTTRFAGLIAGAALALAAFAGDASAQMLDRKVLSIAEAKKLAMAAMEEANKNNWNVVVAILDEGGHLMYLERKDGTQLASADIAVGKAKGALLFRRSTKLMEDTVAQRPAFPTLNRDVAMIEGGLPLMFNNVVVGAIGVSGVASSDDGKIAAAGAAALK
jgi:glc operon protein GlcG